LGDDFSIMTEERVKQARKFFQNDYNCAQSVLKALLSDSTIDIEPHELTNVVAGFGAGVAHQGLACGAVSGAIAAIGLIFGRELKDVEEHKETTYDIAEKFVQRFEEKHGTIICDELTGIKMKDRDLREKARQDGIYSNKCPAFVESAVRIALELTSNPDQ